MCLIISDLKVTVHLRVKETETFTHSECDNNSIIVQSTVQVDDCSFDRCFQELATEGINQVIDIPIVKKLTRFRIETCENCQVQSMTTTGAYTPPVENEGNFSFVDANCKNVKCTLKLIGSNQVFTLFFNVVNVSQKQKPDNLRKLIYSQLKGTVSKKASKPTANGNCNGINYQTVKNVLEAAEKLQTPYEKLNVLSYGFNFPYEFSDCSEVSEIRSLFSSIVEEVPNDTSTINLLHPYGHHVSAYLVRRNKLLDLLENDNNKYSMHNKVNRRIYYNLLLLNDLSILPIRSNFEDITYDSTFVSIQSKLVRFLIGQIMTNDRHNELEISKEIFDIVSEYSPPTFDEAESLKTYERFTNLQIQENQTFKTENLHQTVTEILLSNTIQMHVGNPASSFDHIYRRESCPQPGIPKHEIRYLRGNSKLSQIFTFFLTSSLRNRVIAPKLFNFMVRTYLKKTHTEDQNFQSILNIFDDDLKPFITHVYTKQLSNVLHSEISNIFLFLEDTKYRTGFKTEEKAALTLSLLMQNL